jgi:integrase/recombinase XerD
MAVQLLPSGRLSELERLADDYLNHCRARGLSPRTDRQYSYSLHAVFLPWCNDQGIENVADFDRRAADRFTAALLTRHKPDGQPLSKYSVTTYTRPVRQMVTWARREGEAIEGQPQLPRRPKPVRNILTRDELDSLERAVPEERDKLVIRLFADCGLRLKELKGLQASDVIRADRQAYVQVLGKGDRVRAVPVAPTLLRRLEKLIERRPEPRSSDAVFVAFRRGPGNSYDALTGDGIYQIVQDAARRARLGKRVHPHLLRHSWMTEMVRSGMSPIQLSMIAGASPEVITECYTHLTRDDAYDAMMRALATRRQDR